jgi:adenylate cyclase
LEIELPDFYWTQAYLAATYAQLGRKEEARSAVAKLLKLYPGFGANYRREARKYNATDAQMERFVEGLRKAGLDVPMD